MGNRGGGERQGIFLVFKNIFNVEQDDPGLVLLSNNLSDKREWYLVWILQLQLLNLLKETEIY